MENAQDLDFLSNPIGNNRTPAKIQRAEAGADGFDDGVKQQRRIVTQQEVDAILLQRINMARRAAE